MFLAASGRLTAPSSPVTRHLPGLSMRPVPWKAVILFFWNRNATPLVVAVDHLVLALHHLGEIELGADR